MIDLGTGTLSWPLVILALVAAVVVATGLVVTGVAVWMLVKSRRS